jgi:heme-degrading monooxygenase HmoA
MTIRVICTATIAPAHQAAFERAFAQVTRNVRGTPGHIRDELLRSTEDDTTYVLLAEWESVDLFRAWADDPCHIEAAAPMFPYWADTFKRHVYQVRVTPDAAPTDRGHGLAAQVD